MKALMIIVMLTVAEGYRVQQTHSFSDSTAHSLSEDVSLSEEIQDKSEASAKDMRRAVKGTGAVQPSLLEENQSIGQKDAASWAPAVTARGFPGTGRVTSASQIIMSDGKQTVSETVVDEIQTPDIIPVDASRRAFVGKAAAGAAALAATIAAPAVAGAYVVPDLPYAYDALEPYIDEATMKIHHDKHHGTYVANINKATEGKPEKPILDLMADALEATPVRNSGGGHYNHAFFWEEMAPFSQASKMKPSAALEAMIKRSFGSFEKMKETFEAKAAPGAVFGSGWVWVCVNQKGDALEIVGTPNQDNPLMKGVLGEVMFPIMGIDVWEHAYYLKYQNRRPEYVSNWWNVVNWDKVNSNFEYVTKNHAGVPVKG